MGLHDEFIKLRKQYIEARFSHLNEVQRSAVFCVKGPLLILAGAGSGKTMVLVNRVRYIIEFGDAYNSDKTLREVTNEDVKALRDAVEGGYECSNEIKKLLKIDGAPVWSILAITFTNKAASQLKSRICETTGEQGNDVFAATFHSSCVRFLRRDADRLGFPKNFTIYDADDSVRVLKEICKEKNVDDKMFPPKWMASKIGRIKDSMSSPDDFKATCGDFRDETVAKVYEEYQRRLKKAGALDFDDLIYMMVRLLEENKDVREYYHNRFRYIMVDEYQDTSFAQYKLIELLTNGEQNICVVGDDDQSIYRFRGATIENILGFENCFKSAKVIRLEQNYRSTENILNAANEVIANNLGRKGKTLWSNKGAGDKIKVYCADSELEEAAYVAREILKNKENGTSLSEQAVLYRMNAQSNVIENYFARAGIPYRIYGGQRFYDRMEIKDILAYLHIVENKSDAVRLTRIINKPTRKIGDATVAEVSRIAEGLGLSMLDVIKDAESYETLSRAKNALKDFYDLYEKLLESRANDGLADFVTNVIDLTGYKAMLEAQGEEGKTRLENVEELVSSFRTFETENPERTLGDFLEEVALVSSIDSYDETVDTVTLMTLHSAKGLEFDCVYIVGVEEGIFPSESARYNNDEVEEERRLAYVGITRAKKQLYMTRSNMRMLFGSTRRNPCSRFLNEFSDELKDDLSPERAKKWQSGAMAGAPKSYTVSLGSSITTKPSEPPKATETARGLAFSKGDRVEHKIFGAGVVLSAVPLGGDTLVEINFDKLGVKKAMANYAPMKKL